LVIPCVELPLCTSLTLFLSQVAARSVAKTKLRMMHQWHAANQLLSTFLSPPILESKVFARSLRQRITRWRWITAGACSTGDGVRHDQCRIVLVVVSCILLCTGHSAPLELQHKQEDSCADITAPTQFTPDTVVAVTGCEFSDHLQCSCMCMMARQAGGGCVGVRTWHSSNHTDLTVCFGDGR
jgi:hypothetical protein